MAPARVRLLVATGALGVVAALGVAPAAATRTITTGAAASASAECPGVTADTATDGDTQGPDCGSFTSRRPLVVVLDTSGSMADDDGGGTIKLAGAQAALAQAVRAQRPGAVLGLWTYPRGATDAAGCEPGAWTQQVERTGVDQRAFIASIRGLSADGETPTGPALQMVTDQLKAEGYSGATLLLVSDGLANCGTDPCEVTRSIREDGFDVTVQAAGFQISGEGLAELRCIADASGGDVVEAADSAELQEVIDTFGRAAVEVELTGMPVSTPAGSSGLVTATVTNSSAVDVVNARVQLSFGGSSSTLIPPVLPPIVSLGNLRAGQSRSHTWAISFGAREKDGTAEWKSTAWGTNANPSSRVGKVRIFSGSMRLNDGAGPIADLDGKRIAILGDSYSAGEGAGDYLPGTDVKHGNQCHRSGLTYMAPLFNPEDVLLLACSGATTRHGRGGNVDRNGVQEDQIEPLERRQLDDGAVDAGFISVGGNDIGFGPIVKECLMGHIRDSGAITRALNAALAVTGTPGRFITAAQIISRWDRRCSDDSEYVSTIHADVRDLGPDLTATYRLAYNGLNLPELVAEREGRVAPLYVVAYPQPFPERQWASWCPGFDTEEIAFANELVDRLNGVIETTVRQMRADRYRISFVAPVQGAFLPDHTSCARRGHEPYLNPVTLMTAAVPAATDYVTGSAIAAQFMHPNAAGYAAETDTIIAWSAITDDPDTPPGGGEWRVGTPMPWSVPVIGSWHDITEATTLPALQGGSLDVDAVQGSVTGGVLDVRGGQTVPVTVQGGAPNALVRISMQSRQKVIGLFHLGPDGAGTGTMAIPLAAAPGGHRLTVLTTAADGAPLVMSHEIDVARRFPFWLAPLGLLTILCGVASCALLARERRHRARGRTEG